MRAAAKAEPRPSTHPAAPPPRAAAAMGPRASWSLLVRMLTTMLSPPSPSLPPPAGEPGGQAGGERMERMADSERFSASRQPQLQQRSLSYSNLSTLQAVRLPVVAHRRPRVAAHVLLVSGRGG